MRKPGLPRQVQLRDLVEDRIVVEAEIAAQDVDEHALLRGHRRSLPRLRMPSKGRTIRKPTIPRSKSTDRRARLCPTGDEELIRSVRHDSHRTQGARNNHTFCILVPDEQLRTNARPAEVSHWRPASAGVLRRPEELGRTGPHFWGIDGRAQGWPPEWAVEVRLDLQSLFCSILA